MSEHVTVLRRSRDRLAIRRADRVLRPLRRSTRREGTNVALLPRTPISRVYMNAKGSEALAGAPSREALRGLAALNQYDRHDPTSSDRARSRRWTRNSRPPERPIAGAITSRSTGPSDA